MRGAPNAVSDGDDVSGRAAEPMFWGAGTVLFQAYAGALNPLNTASRVEVAHLFMNFCMDMVK